MMHPSAHRSAGYDSGEFVSTSGDTYSAVPTKDVARPCRQGIPGAAAVRPAHAAMSACMSSKQQQQGCRDMCWRGAPPCKALLLIPLSWASPQLAEGNKLWHCQSQSASSGRSQLAADFQV
eukprot:364682-Chlamydomonas_euryale.AAC.23